ncbi:MAG: hypothetical protein U0793_29715 [Gemmataceae bacterium]
MDDKKLAHDIGHGDRPPQGGVAAWEEIAAGRFMPRRIRGSFRGRALG